MKEIPLTHGLVALVDDEDFDRLSQYRWKASTNGPHRETRYAIRNVIRTNQEGVSYKSSVPMHRDILRCEEGTYVDHIDLDGLNNQKANLRVATRSENGGNARKRANNTTGFKGVVLRTWQGGTSCYAARTTFQGKSIHIGLFASAEDAARAYDKKARELWGEFARLNFPDTGERAA